MMRTSVSLAVFEPKPTAPVLFWGDLDRATGQIRDLGYDGVDLFILDPEAEASRMVLRHLRRKNLGVGVVMPAAMAGMGLFLGDQSAEIRNEIVERMKGIICYAGEAGGMVSLGLVRGSVAENDSTEELLKRFAGSVERLLPTAEECDVQLVIEPINRYEINTLNSSLEALDFIQKSGLPLGLMLDTFHMNIEDPSPKESFRRCLPLLRHVHFLDSNRLAPGMGHMDMEGLYVLLQELRYEGYLCLEALAKPDSLTCASKGAEFFRQMRQRHPV